MNNKKKGTKGEEQAVRYLMKISYTIIRRNTYTPYGEIDIIAQKEAELIFIEVKLRNSQAYGHITEQITEQKQKRLIQSAKYFLWNEEKTLQFNTTRFDYIGLMYTKGIYQLSHIKNIINL